MITAEVIDSIYKQYPKRATSIDELDFASLFEKAAANHNLSVDPESEELTIGSISKTLLSGQFHLKMSTLSFPLKIGLPLCCTLQ